MATVDKLAMQKLLLAHFRVTRAAEVQAELFVTDGNDPNAFAGMHNGKSMIAVNFGMLKLIGEAIDEFAALVGHEAAHLAKNHGESARNRANTLNAVGTLFAMGLGAAGVPVGGTVAGLTVDLIDSAYSRDDEREADTLGIGYAQAAGYDPYGAVRLHEKLAKVSGPRLLPFLSSHPGGTERAEAIKALIETGKADAVPPRE
jgi:predicted Zn-dependent protease